MRFVPGLALLAACAAQTAVDLPKIDPETLRGGERFEFDAAGDRRTSWGVAGLRRWYPGEELPALFERTLVFDAPPPEGSVLEWIFTGDEGGVTVRLERGRVRLTQRHYDSFGHYSEIPPKTRYPERVWQQGDVLFQGSLQSITVVMDHRLSVAVLLNGKEALRQTCLLDMRRHQAAWTPADGVTTGRFAIRALSPQPVVTTVRVNPGRRYQSVYGFGGILSVPAWAKLSAEGRRRWWDLLLEYNLLIHREYPNGDYLKADLSNFDRLEEATPHYYGDNFPNGEISDFDYIREVRRLGGKVLFEFWDLPKWARREYKSADGRVWRRAPIVDEYVRAVVGYCRISREKAGAPPDVVGIQNEVTQPAELWHEMILRLRQELDQAGFSGVRIHMPDSGTLAGGTEWAHAIARSPAAWKAIDWAASHVYDFQRFFENPDGYDAVIQRWREATAGKPFLSTEFTVNASAYQSLSYRTAFAQAQLYHKNMAMMDAAALLYCWTLLDVEQRSFGGTRSLFVPDRSRGWIPVPSSYQLRTFGAFSRRLREGMARIGAESSDQHLLATAYEGDGGAKTVVLVNRSTAPQRVQLEWLGARLTIAERVSPYQENAVLDSAAPPFTVQPGEILTLTNVPLRGRRRSPSR